MLINAFSDQFLKPDLSL